jgi:predicted nucleotidyltransferase
MNTAGIIAEYNPFHNGHLWQINEARRITGCEYLVVVMSGNHVQRGEPAIYDKWQRTRAALTHGADAVIELPSYYAVAAAGYFARGAVRLIQATNVVDWLCFGSECGTLAPLEAAADVLIDEPPLFKQALRDKLALGCSYANARGAALSQFVGGVSPDFFAQPNNTLGIEYIKVLKSYGSRIKPIALPRHSSGGIASASSIRQLIHAGQASEAARLMPGHTDYTSARKLDDYSAFYKKFLYLSRELYKKNLSGVMERCANTPDYDDGLFNRFVNEANRYELISEIIAAVKTKRFTHTRLQRAVMHLILGITAGDMAALEQQGGPPYLRILGFRTDSGPLIGKMATGAALPIVVDAAGRHKLPPFAREVFEREARGELSIPVIKQAK